MIKVTDNQLELCNKYLQGKKNEDDLYTLFKSYINDYIRVFGWKSWQYDPVPKIVKNFCNVVI